MKIIVFGPVLKNTRSAYGGGQGGIVSAVSRMLTYFDKRKLNYIYTEYSTRSLGRYWFLLLPYRFTKDIFNFSRVCATSGNKKIAHIIADSGLAVYRTCAVILISKIFKLKVICDVRGNGLGEFANERASISQGLAWSFIIHFSSSVLVQKRSTVLALKAKYKNKIYLHPNWVSVEDQYRRQYPILVDKTLKVVFVGYCFEKKGVFEIVEACELAVDEGLSIDLHFVGAESEQFSSLLDSKKPRSRLSIMRHGVLPNNQTRIMLTYYDIFVFPSFFSSEGHPNVINEAMFASLAIITSRVGAVTEILDDDSAYFIEPKSANSLKDCLLEINKSRDVARRKSIFAFNKVNLLYDESNVLSNLVRLYEKT